MAEPDILWRLHLSAAPSTVFDALDSDDGRASFWAESAVESDGQIEFVFANGMRHTSSILERRRPARWVIRYFGARTEFALAGDGDGGTDLTLTVTDVSPGDHLEMYAGWLNVLLPLKAAVDFGVDLRNHDPGRTWDQRYVDQ